MFQVEWLGDAMNELAAIWMEADSDSRRSINLAVRRIDARLAIDPFQTGESREGWTRIDFEVPLGVQFSVDEAQARVFVIHVWRFGPKRKD